MWKYLLILALILVGFLLVFRPRESHEPKDYITIAEVKIPVEVARTANEKEIGLSGRKSLPQNQGMLFLFEQKGLPVFWMKGMNFNLDLIWIDEDEVVDVTEDVSKPEKNLSGDLPLYRPNQPTTVVLEVNSGFIKTNNIKIGDIVGLYLK